MAIARLHRTLSRTILTLGVVSLVACGGGGGGKKKDPAPDTTPNAYNYTATSNAEPSTVITSAPVTITGINAATPVSITGGEYSISGGAFTSAAGTVTSGQTITIRLTAPAANSTSASAQLTVGGVAATFTVTTKADTTPDAFSFTAQTNAALNTEYTSNTITVAGIDAATPISIAGGTYSINGGGAFTAAAGTVLVNNTVVVKGTSTSASESTHNVVLTIGGVSATYAITTIADTTPPVAEFKFPTPYTMSEANTVKVRGTATDDHAITSVKVVVRSYNLEAPTVTLSTQTIDVTPKAAGDYSSWTADIPLTALAENEVKVIAMDDRENETLPADANKVVIRQADVRSAFPDEINQFDSARSLVFDKYDGRSRVLVASPIGNYKDVMAVDLVTGRRSIAFTSPDCGLWGLTIDPISKHIFGTCEGNLYEFNLNNGELVSSYRVGGATIPSMALDRNNGRNRLVLLERRDNQSTGGIFSFALDTKITSTISAAEQLPPFEVGESFLLDGDNFLVPGSDLKSDFGGQIISVNALDGTRKVLSDNSIGAGDLYGGSGYFDTPWLSAIAKDENSSRFFVYENWSNRIFTVDQEAMNRKLFTDISYTQQDVDRTHLRSVDMKIDVAQGHLYVTDAERASIIIVDSETGGKVILSKSKNTR